MTDKKTYCVKCHLLGDYVPDGGPSDWAPNLDRVYQRLRPDFVEAWLANPQRKLPYTGMPINFPPRIDPNETIRRQFIPGDSRDALEAVVDLLVNFDALMKSQTSMKSLVKEPPPEEKPAEEAAAAEESAERGRARIPIVDETELGPNITQ